jgi:hypothetical protein
MAVYLAVFNVSRVPWTVLQFFGAKRSKTRIWHTLQA